MSRERAIVFGGFSESEVHLDSFTNEVATVFEDVEMLTWPQAYRMRERLSHQDMSGTTIITHSAGAMHIPHIVPRGREHGGAERVFTLCGVEPTLPHLAILRASRVALNSRHGSGDRNATLKDSLYELVRSPDHFRILGRIATFSTATQLICRRRHFPEGMYYLPAEKDEFAFGDLHTVNTARRNGIVAEYLGSESTHTYPLTNPKETVAQMRGLLEMQASAEPIAS